ncbi:MAG TPA: BamA/TamA family outer membrane protein [Gemmatimonadales bacterium]|nr:BamA/TamA family outer membrane protein [Gemmatimonadales bacterium]
MSRPGLLVLALAAALGLAPRAAAQDRPAAERWLDSRYPIIRYSGNDGLSLGLRFLWTQRAPFGAPYYHRGALTADVAWSTVGSGGVGLRFTAPGLARDWRFDASAAALRQARFEYYGLGEGSRYVADSVTDLQKYFYKVRRSWAFVRGEASRRLAGRLWLAAMAQYQVADFEHLPGPSQFKADFGAGRRETDAIGRLALVYDARDNDYDTHRGALLDAGWIQGSAGGGYGRWVVDARGWLPFGEWQSTWLSARVVASASPDDAMPLDARLYLPVWEGQVRVLGGAESARGFLDQRYIGRDVLFGNLTVQHDLVNAGGFGAAGLLAFADAGRVFEQERFRLTTDGVKLGAGGGVYLRILRTGVYTFNFAKGPDGFVFTLGNGWMF